MGRSRRFLLYLLVCTFLLCSCSPSDETNALEDSAACLTEETGSTQETATQETTTESTEETSTQSTEESVSQEATEETTAGDTVQAESPLEPVSQWTPICQEFIYLWSAPGSSQALDKIPLGETLQFIKWQGKYALVSFRGQQGYVRTNYIRPAENSYFTKNLAVVAPTVQYSYEQMLLDLDRLQALYPNAVRIGSIGTSELGRNIPVLQIGQTDAEYHVLIQAAIHGREHFTAWLAVAIVDSALLHNRLNGNICYHIIPMANPDGVVISQSGTLNQVQETIYQNDLQLGYTSSGMATYATQWKANALGIDLNRNFPSGWDASKEHPGPSSEKYRGDAAFCAVESRALRDYTLQHNFDATVSIHSHGSVIYYQYGSRQPVNQLSYSFAQAIEALTGYIPTRFDNTTGAGYKDWAMEELGIPSLTLEIGSSQTPLIQRDMYNTFVRCQDLLPAIYRWLSGS